jgi:hypothetical protein
VTKTIGDDYRIYNLIIILNAGFVASVRCGLFKMSNMSHLPMLLSLDTTKTQVYMATWLQQKEWYKLGLH